MAMHRKWWKIGTKGSCFCRLTRIRSFHDTYGVMQVGDVMKNWPVFNKRSLYANRLHPADSGICMPFFNHKYVGNSGKAWRQFCHTISWIVRRETRAREALNRSGLSQIFGGVYQYCRVYLRWQRSRRLPNSRNQESSLYYSNHLYHHQQCPPRLNNRILAYHRP